MSNEMSKNSIVFIILYLIFKGCLLAQTTFNKTFDFTNGIEQVYSVATVEDGFILLGSGWGNEIGEFFDVKLKYAKIDFEGNLLWQIFLGDTALNYFIYPKGSLLCHDGNVIFCGSLQTPTTSEIHLIKINSSSGDTIFYKVFSFDDYIYGAQIQELTDGTFITLGWDSNDTFAYILLKTTSDGQFIWEKRYGLTFEEHPTDFNIVSDTIYVISGNSLCTTEGYRLRKIDVDGNIISTNIFVDDCVAYGLKSISDGYIGAGAYFPAPPYQTFTYKTDGDGNVLWHYETNIDMDTLEYEQLFPDIVKELPNGDMIVTGYFSSNYIGSYVGLVSKINNEGIPYWERHYTSTNDLYDDNIIYDVDFSNDGGFILVGSAFGEEELEGQNFWALKLDSMGCLIPGCDTLDIPIIELPFDQAGILIYPNPVHKEAIIQLTLDHYFNYKDLQIQITDIAGQMVRKIYISNSNIVIDDNTIRFSFQRELIPDGIYLLNIYSEGNILGCGKIILQ